MGAGYHTSDQVLVGGLLGATFACAWYSLCQLKLIQLVRAWMPVSGRLPVEPVLVILVLGACAVGSVERKIKAWFSREKSS